MVLTLAPVTDEDMSRVTAIIFDSLSGSVYIDAVYPHSDDPARREQSAKANLDRSRTDRTLHWVKLTDTDLGEIIAMCMWGIYETRDTRPPETMLDGPEGRWDSAEDKEWARCLFKCSKAARWEAMRTVEEPLLCLNVMAVEPKHQRRGAGTLLLKWGLEIADRMGAVCILEASPSGEGLYTKYGFKVKERSIVEVPAKFADRPKHESVFMRREPVLT